MVIVCVFVLKIVYTELVKYRLEFKKNSFNPDTGLQDTLKTETALQFELS